MAGRYGGGSTAPQGQAEGREGKGWGLRNMNTVGSTGWEPTTLYLVVLVILEVIAYGALRYAFRSAHGG